MLRIWPPPAREDLQIADLQEIYAFPNHGEPFVRMNYVMSANAIAAVDGVSAGLSFPTDRLLFASLRQSADVILVGAETARAERYRGARSSFESRAERQSRGLAAVPPIAVVTASALIDPDGPLFTDTSVPPLILTTTSADPIQLRELASAGAIIDVGSGPRLSPHEIITMLSRRGLQRILCEGGSSLFGDLVAADSVDEICMSIRNVAVGGSTSLTRGPETPVLPMALRSVIAEQDGLLLQYRRQREPSILGEGLLATRES